MARLNRIGNTERLIMALRDLAGDYEGVPNIDFLYSLKSFTAFKKILIEEQYSNNYYNIYSAVGDMIEEAMGLE